MTIEKVLGTPLVFAFLCLIPCSKRMTRVIFTAGAILAALGAWSFVFGVSGSPRVFAFGGNLMMDSLSAVFVLLITGVGVLSSAYAGGYLFRDGETAIPSVKLRRYAFFFHLFLFTMLLTVFSNNLGIMWIAIEGTTLASAFLVNTDDKKSSIEAAWKYLIICSVGISLAFFGVILAYYSAVARTAVGESGLLLNWTFLLENARQLDPKIIQLAFIFVLVGYGTKAGLAPFHSWLPDAHSQAPAPVSALLSGVLLSCAVLGILRFHILTTAATGSNFSGTLLVVFGVFSVMIAVPFILEQKDYKRMLAYSSVEHMGLAAVGLGFGSAIGIYGALLHISTTRSPSPSFFTTGHILYLFQTKEISQVKGIFRRSRFWGLFSSPPLWRLRDASFNIFVSEFLILSAGFQAKKFVACGILLVLLSLVFIGFLKHSNQMTFGESEKVPVKPKSLVMNGVLLVGMVLILMMGFYIPGPLQHLLQEASRVAAGGASL